MTGNEKIMKGGKEWEREREFNYFWKKGSKEEKKREKGKLIEGEWGLSIDNQGMLIQKAIPDQKRKSEIKQNC